MAVCGIIFPVKKLDASHIGLNAHLLCLNANYRAAGPNWYIYNMLTHLPAVDPELQYSAFLSEPNFSPPHGMRVSRPQWPTGSPYSRIVWEQLIAPIALRRQKVDLFHAMAFVAPIASPCPTVVTVFDLGFLLFPAAFKTMNRIYLRTMTKASSRKAKRVIAISDSTRRAVIAKLGIPGDRVETIYCGVDPSFHPPSAAEVQAFREEKSLPEHFVFFLGTIEPRKNVSRLVEAFAALPASSSMEASSPHLIIAGGRGWFSDPVFARIEELGIKDRVHVVGYVPEEEKMLWYGAATCFCYPSLYEGFGLPPLEAMACGVPVITSDTSSLPEVVGDAGLTVPPDQTSALSEALHRVLSDGVLRATLSEKGLARAVKFSWAESARQTAAVYRAAIADQRGKEKS